MAQLGEPSADDVSWIMPTGPLYLVWRRAPQPAFFWGCPASAEAACLPSQAQGKPLESSTFGYLEKEKDSYFQVTLAPFPLHLLSNNNDQISLFI